MGLINALDDHDDGFETWQLPELTLQAGQDGNTSFLEWTTALSPTFGSIHESLLTANAEPSVVPPKHRNVDGDADTEYGSLSPDLQQQTFDPFWSPPGGRADGIGYFFNHIINLKPETGATLWDELPNIWDGVGPCSQLPLATKAMSLASLGGAVRCPSIIDQAVATAGECFAPLQRALKHPVASCADDTLMAVHMLGMYEACLTTYGSHSHLLGDAHAKGLAALLKHRGRAQFQNPRSKKLYSMVRHDLVDACIYRSEPCQDLLGNLKPTADESDNPDIALTDLQIRVAKIRTETQYILNSGNCGGTQEKLLTTLHKSQDIDGDLERWCHSLDPSWRYTEIDVTSSQFGTDTYGECVHEYGNKWIGSLWNAYRYARVTLQSATLDLLARVRVPDDIAYSRWQKQARIIIQTMADDFCASVPYIFESPHDNGIGWLLLIGPLHGWVRVHHLPKEQHQWIKKQYVRACKEVTEGMGQSDPSNLVTLERLPTAFFMRPILTDQHIVPRNTFFSQTTPAPSSRTLSEVSSPAFIPDTSERSETRSVRSSPSVGTGHSAASVRKSTPARKSAPAIKANHHFVYASDIGKLKPAQQRETRAFVMNHYLRTVAEERRSGPRTLCRSKVVS